MRAGVLATQHSVLEGLQGHSPVFGAPVYLSPIRPVVREVKTHSSECAILIHQVCYAGAIHYKFALHARKIGLHEVHMYSHVGKSQHSADIMDT